MAGTFARRLYCTIAASGSNNANMLVPRNSKLVGILVSIYGIAAAAIDARGMVDVSKVNVSQIGTNDVPNTLGSASWSAPIASAGFATNVFIPVGAVDFRGGDYIYVHAYAVGTAPTSCFAHVTCYLTD